MLLVRCERHPHSNPLSAARGAARRLRRLEQQQQQRAGSIAGVRACAVPFVVGALCPRATRARGTQQPHARPRAPRAFARTARMQLAAAPPRPRGTKRTAASDTNDDTTPTHTPPADDVEEEEEPPGLLVDAPRLPPGAPRWRRRAFHALHAPAHHAAVLCLIVASVATSTTALLLNLFTCDARERAALHSRSGVDSAVARALAALHWLAVALLSAQAAERALHARRRGGPHPLPAGAAPRRGCHPRHGLAGR
jgi:hypothetical protein